MIVLIISTVGSELPPGGWGIWGLVAGKDEIENVKFGVVCFQGWCESFEQGKNP
jgi:hypothetical protein